MTVKAVSTIVDEKTKKLEESRRQLAVAIQLAGDIARLRKKLFDEYVAAGFTERQALELIKDK